VAAVIVIVLTVHIFGTLQPTQVSCCTSVNLTPKGEERLRQFGEYVMGWFGGISRRGCSFHADGSDEAVC